MRDGRPRPPRPRNHGSLHEARHRLQPPPHVRRREGGEVRVHREPRRAGLGPADLPQLPQVGRRLGLRLAGLARHGRPPGAARRADATLPGKILGQARVPHRRGHRGVLRGVLQPDALAPPPLFPLAGLLRRGLLADLQAHQSGFLRRGHGRRRAGRPRLGARLSLPPAAGDAEGAGPTSGWGSSCTSPSPRTRSSGCCPTAGAPRCWRGCWGRTWSASTPTTMPSTSSRASAGSSSRTTRWAGSSWPTGSPTSTPSRWASSSTRSRARRGDEATVRTRDELAAIARRLSRHPLDRPAGLHQGDRQPAAGLQGLPRGQPRLACAGSCC